jgi:hypothetical protein
MRAAGNRANDKGEHMRFSREPRIHPIPLADLRPTQITVGMREVNEKRAAWRAHGDGAKADFLGAHLIPVVLGPRKKHLWLIIIIWRGRCSMRGWKRLR